MNTGSKTITVLTVFGTRPEAIKLAPLVNELSRRPETFRSRVCVTAQHREMLDSILRVFDIRPDYDLAIMQKGQSLFDITSRALLGLQSVLESERPDMVIVQGDTTTTFAASLAAYYCRIPVGHVEAGLRTNDKFQPYPEEINRRLTSQIADLHFAPTEASRQNLLREGTDPARIFVTGNTVIDALLDVVKRQSDIEQQRTWTAHFEALGLKIDSSKRHILITGHRRENFGEGMQNICEAIRELALRFPDVEFTYPVHLNPNVQGPVYGLLQGIANIHLLPPQDYEPFVFLMSKSFLILTDSGGVQEEAPSLRVPVLVMRNTTERPEGLQSGWVRLIGPNKDRIIESTIEALRAGEHSGARGENPYGDGKSAQRIAAILRQHLERASEPLSVVTAAATD